MKNETKPVFVRGKRNIGKQEKYIISLYVFKYIYLKFDLKKRNKIDEENSDFFIHREKINGQLYSRLLL